MEWQEGAGSELQGDIAEVGGLCEPTDVPEGGREGLWAISMCRTPQAFQAPAEPLCASTRKRPASGPCRDSAQDHLGQVTGAPWGMPGAGKRGALWGDSEPWLLFTRQKALLPSLTSCLQMRFYLDKGFSFALTLKNHRST